MKHICNVDIAQLHDNLSDYIDKEVTFGGMVTSTLQRTAKNGSLFGVLGIENYSGSMDFRLFKENYLKMRHMMVAGNLLLIHAKVEANHYNEASVNVNIRDMTLLEDALNKVMRKLTLYIDPLNVKDEFIDELVKMRHDYPGKTGLMISLVSVDKKRPLVLKSKSGKVEPRLF